MIPSARQDGFLTSISITKALVINIVLITAVIGALCAWLVAFVGERGIRHGETERLAALSGSVASQIAKAMTERQVDVRFLRDQFEQELATASTASRRAALERVQAGHRHFSWLGVVVPDGVIRVGTGGLLEGVSVAGRNWFEGARHAPVFFGNIHQAKLLAAHVRNSDGAPLYLLDIAMPLRDAKGEIVGILGSHLNWRMIEEVVQQAIDTAAGSVVPGVAVVDAEGVILYDSKGAVGKIGKLLDDQSPGRLMEADWPGEVEKSYLTQATMPVGGIFSGHGWRVVARVSASAVGADVARMKWQVMGVTFAAGLMFSLLGLLAVRPMTRPLGALVEAIDRFGETEALPPPMSDKRITEIVDLHGAFLGMAARVVAHKEMLRETQIEVVRTLGRAGEFRDNETGNHVLRMSLCCARLAELAKWEADATEMLRLASQMHDIGKIGIPDNVLLKPGRFDDAERAIMERHSEIGARILSGVEAPLTVMARTIALSHHEKWDGSGYPARLAGESIAEEARIAAICDVFDALLSSRPYKPGWPLEQVKKFMAEQSGLHFDPQLIDLFLENFDDFVTIRERFSDEPAATTTPG